MFGKKDPTTETLQLLRQRETELEKARADLAEAEAARAAKPEASDLELDELDAAVHRNSTLVTRAEERHGIALRRHEDAVQAKKAAERDALQKAARAKAEAVAKSISKRQCELTLGFLELMREIADAEIALQAAGLEDASPEQATRSRDLPEKVLHEDTVELWAYPRDALPLPTDQQLNVLPELNDSRRGKLQYRDASGYGSNDVELKRFRVRRFLPAFRGRANALAQSLRLPPLVGPYGDIWEPIGSDNPEAVREELLKAKRRLDHQLEASKSADVERQPQVTLTLIGSTLDDAAAELSGRNAERTA
jgi:hypothetical protein